MSTATGFTVRRRQGRAHTGWPTALVWAGAIDQCFGFVPKRDCAFAQADDLVPDIAAAEKRMLVGRTKLSASLRLLAQTEVFFLELARKLQQLPLPPNARPRQRAGQAKLKEAFPLALDGSTGVFSRLAFYSDDGGRLDDGVQTPEEATTPLASSGAPKPSGADEAIQEDVDFTELDNEVRCVGGPELPRALSCAVLCRSPLLLGVKGASPLPLPHRSCLPVISHAPRRPARSLRPCRTWKRSWMQS